MKRLLTSAIALSLLASAGAAAAQPRHDDHRNDHGRYEQGRHDNGNHYGQRKHWNRGQRLPTTYYRDRGHYVDYRAHHLRAPPRGYQWVRADNDYALVALTTGLIAAIVAASN
jgi:Ni/Co efflux regulator RcnB